MLTVSCGEVVLRQAGEADDDLLVALLPDDFDHDPTFPLVDGRSLRDHREAWLRHWLAGFRNPVAGQQAWAFVVEHGGRPVGLQVLEAPVPASTGALDTSSFLVPDARGRRLGVAMRTAVLDFGFSVLGATRAASSARPGNIASQRVSERVGYRCTGRREPVVAGSVRPLVDFEITREEWFSRPHLEVVIEGLEPVVAG